MRSLSKRQRHRESGGKQRVRWKTVEATTWEAETQRVRWKRRFRPLSKRQRHRESGEKTVQATTWEAETQRVR